MAWRISWKVLSTALAPVMAVESTISSALGSRIFWSTAVRITDWKATQGGVAEADRIQIQVQRRLPAKVEAGPFPGLPVRDFIMKHEDQNLTHEDGWQGRAALTWCIQGGEVLFMKDIVSDHAHLVDAALTNDRTT